MADRTLRGTRLSTFSFESETNVVPSERRITTYVCPQGHRIELPFSVDANGIELYLRRLNVGSMMTPIGPEYVAP